MRGHHQVADGLIAVFLRHLAHGKEIAEALAHLAVIDIDVTVMHPVMGKRHAVAALALGNLIFMVGENQVLAAAVDVNGLAQIAPGHSGALDMPAGTALAPGGAPARLAGLRSLPQGEVHGVLLDFAGRNTRPGLQVLKRLVGKLAVTRVFHGAEIDVAVLRRIGKALLLQIGNNMDNFIHIFRRQRVNRRRAHVQARGVGLVLLDITPGNREVIAALLVGLSDDLVVDVCKILHIGNAQAPVLQVTAKDVEHTNGPGVADMDIVVNRGAAGVNMGFSGHNGLKFFFLASQGVVNFHLVCSFT